MINVSCYAFVGLQMLKYMQSKEKRKVRGLPLFECQPQVLLELFLWNEESCLQKQARGV